MEITNIWVLLEVKSERQTICKKIEASIEGKGI